MYGYYIQHFIVRDVIEAALMASTAMLPARKTNFHFYKYTKEKTLNRSRH